MLSHLSLSLSDVHEQNSFSQAEWLGRLRPFLTDLDCPGPCSLALMKRERGEADVTVECQIGVSSLHDSRKHAGCRSCALTSRHRRSKRRVLALCYSIVVKQCKHRFVLPFGGKMEIPYVSHMEMFAPIRFMHKTNPVAHGMCWKKRTHSCWVLFICSC